MNKEENMKEEVKKEKISKKKFLTFGILGLFALAMVSAGLIQYFGMFSFTATVLPAISVDGKLAPIITHKMPETSPGGEVFCWLHKVQNDASIPIDLELTVYDGEVLYNPLDGVVVNMYGVPETTTLHMESKDSSWGVNGLMTADLVFDTVNPSFVGTLTTTGLAAEDYALIYYPDQEDRFDPLNWNGAGGQVIKTFIGDQTNLAIDVDLARNLPHSDDWNINPSPNYCNYANGFDDYDHCRGATLWIVRTSDLTDSTDLPLTSWNPTNWLFETDLITYSDCDFDEGLPKVVDFTEDRETLTDGILETKSHTMTPMLICYDFDVMAQGEFDLDAVLNPVA